MILVGQYDSPYVRRVAITLNLLGLPFERDTRSAFRDAEAMRKINPTGRIPSLILDDGEVLIDSAAIVDYLDEQVGPARALLPARGVERRRALRRIGLACSGIDKATVVVYERLFRPVELHFQPWLTRCRIQVDGALAALEAETGALFAGGAAWFGGDRPGQSDVVVDCLLAYLRHRAPEMFPAGVYPALDRFTDACAALPAFASAHPETDERAAGG